MTRWSSLARRPEKPWLVWDPDRWWLPVPWEGAVVVTALCVGVPFLTLLLVGRRSLVLFIAAGFIWAFASAWLTFWWRRRRRRQLAGRMRGDDWVCLDCLHVEHLTIP